MTSNDDKVVSRRNPGYAGNTNRSAQSARSRQPVKTTNKAGTKKPGEKKSAKKNQGNDVGTKIIMNLSNSVIRIAFDVIIYLLLIFATIYCCKYAYNFCFQVFGSASATNSRDAITMTVTINDGESTLDIGERLEEYGLIPNKYSFVVKGRLDKYSIKPGTFELSSDMDYDKILEIICDTNNAIKQEDDSSDSTGGDSSGDGTGSGDGTDNTV